MFKVLTLNKISKVGLSQLPENNYEILNESPAPDGILLRSFNMHDMEMPSSLLAVGRAGAGVNNIPIDKCSEKGIVVFNTPGANANAVKEIVMFALLVSSRKIYEGISWTQSLNGQEGVAKTVESGKSAFVGPEIMGKKLGIVGLGAIGMLVVGAANGLGMEVIGYDPFLDRSGTSGLTQVDSLDKIYEQCDYITLHVPATGDTKGMINENTIKKMKTGVRIINFSRGELVNNADIKAALSEGSVSCYVTDFPSEEVLGVDHIITIPHLGASTPESEENCAAMAAAQLKAYLETGSIKNSVNFPNTELGEVKGNRICVLCKKSDGVSEVISTAISAKGLKIDNTVTSARGDYQYSAFDVTGDVSAISAELEAVSGVLRVRVL